MSSTRRCRACVPNLAWWLTTLSRRRSLSAAALCRGDMDDRWALRFDPADSVLRIHRSWSGFCIFEIGFELREDGLEVGPSWVNRDPEQFKGSDVAQDRLTAMSLIDRLLLGR